jgi:hypothetical protein
VAQGPESENSIYDFIYVDHQRVALFLSQFDQSGKLTGLTRSVREVHQKTLSAGVDKLVVAKRESESSATEEMQREFDPQWVLPLTLLDALEDEQLIHRDISTAALGQFVLCSGSLSIVDFAILKSLAELPAFKKQLTLRFDQQLKGAAKGMKEMGELLRQFLTILPYNLQATIATPQREVWCCLKQEGMMLPQAEVFLKHGFGLPGTWHALGLLDARPNESSSVQSPKTTPSLLEIFTNQLGPAVRQAFGRPSRAFGITPIILFREVSRESLPQ